MIFFAKLNLHPIFTKLPLSKKAFFIALISVFAFSCDYQKEEIQDNYFIGKWKVKLKNDTDTPIYILQLLDNNQWVLESEYDTGDQWRYDSDTLILENYTKGKIKSGDKVYLKDEDMRYIITNRGDHYFDAVPYFGWNSEHSIEVRFERM